MTPEIEERGHGIYIEWYYGRRVPAVRVHPGAVADQAHSDTWAETIRYLMRGWPSDTPYRAVNDTTYSQHTPYGSRSAERLVDSLPRDIRGRLGVVIPLSPMQAIIRLFSGQLVRQRFPHLEMRVFTHFENALAWASEGLEGRD